MPSRMERFGLPKEEALQVLQTAPVGHFATLGADGYPYVIPVHFVVLNEAIYFHCALKGEKLQNLVREPKTGFSAEVFGGVHVDEPNNPCATETTYKSAVARGSAKVIEDRAEKHRALLAILAKYTPEMDPALLTEKAEAAVAVVRMELEHLTGKFHP